MASSKQEKALEGTGKVLSPARYQKLLGDVARLIEEARTRAEQAAANVLVAAYHQVGKRIEREKATDKAGYGEHLLDSLAVDLRIDRRTLERACLFSRVYQAPPRRGLTWAHYRELLKLKDAKERAYYEGLAATEHLSQRALVQAIAADEFSRHQPPALASKTDLDRPKPTSFVYAVEVVRVVDGDTMLVRIDLGFRISTEVRIRLARVNAADAKTKAGRAATAFVVSELARAESVAVQTEWPDLHGRYVAHVFYSSRARTPAQLAAKGSYLNQRMLQEQVAALA
jgi:endonuclease YncB( thermonuclease family)